jgi:hypothetical protein
MPSIDCYNRQASTCERITHQRASDASPDHYDVTASIGRKRWADLTDSVAKEPERMR